MLLENVYRSRPGAMVIQSIRIYREAKDEAVLFVVVSKKMERGTC